MKLTAHLKGPRRRPGKPDPRRQADYLARRAADDYRLSIKPFASVESRAWRHDKFLASVRDGIGLIGVEKFLTAFLNALGGVDADAYPDAVAAIRELGRKNDE
jgi:hypothetical protein